LSFGKIGKNPQKSRTTQNFCKNHRKNMAKAHKKIRAAAKNEIKSKSAAGSINRGTGKTEPAPSIGRMGSRKRGKR
jgi:hypothetical protein